MTNSADPDQKPTDLDLHCLLRQGMTCSAREGLKCSKNRHALKCVKIDSHMSATSEKLQTRKKSFYMYANSVDPHQPVH